jgi:hypothetical protein
MEGLKIGAMLTTAASKEREEARKSAQANDGTGQVLIDECVSPMQCLDRDRRGYSIRLNQFCVVVFRGGQLSTDLAMV